MKAFTRTVYGGPEVLRLSETDKPLVGDDQILVRVRANSANPADWHILRGKPYFARLTFGLFTPKDKIPGADFAGVVEAAGRNVNDFRAGDRVFGESLKEAPLPNTSRCPRRFARACPPRSTFPSWLPFRLPD